MSIDRRKEVNWRGEHLIAGSILNDKIGGCTKTRFATIPLQIRVGVLMDHPSPHMAAFLDALAERTDLAVQVVYFRPGAPERRWGDPAGGLPHRFATAAKQRSALLNAPAVVSAMRSTRVDIWVVNAVYTALETWVCIGWLNAARLPWVYMNEPIRPRRGVDSMKLAVVRALLNRSAGHIGMGRTAEARYRELLDNVKPSCSVAYYVDLADFLALTVPMTPIDSTPVRFFTAAQMIARKGIDVLLAACERLPATGWELTLAGEGPLKRTFERAFGQRFRDGQVRFLGEVPYAKRATVFAGQHIFVFPSRWDGWGMAPVEAMAAGLPVISTDQVMSMRDFVRNGENGFLVPSDDPSALADSMRWFMEHREAIPVMGRAARVALKDYRAEFGAEVFVEFVSRVVRERRHARQIDRSTSLAARDTPPTWRWLTESENHLVNFRQRARTLSKRAIIDASLRMPWRSRNPVGHRIMVYHVVLREDRKAFEEQLRFLQDHFHLTTVRNLAKKLRDGATTQTLAISFDDGFRVLMSDALELLEKHGIKATFFVPTGFIALSNDPDQAAEFCSQVHYYKQPLRPMTVDDLRTLHRLGHEIGSHGVSHLAMNSVSHALAAKELGDSRAKLAEWVGEAPAGFAYPYGDFNNSVCDPPTLVRQAGYEYAVTLRRGPLTNNAPQMTLHREHAEGNWRVHDLRYFLSC
ncbi:MAG: glycosyltransferase [Burkholderiales bacterium]|nr:glycosyltransferase [Burkholderiales bacterium]